MKVEVADRKNMYSMCVATIVDVIGDRLRMRYDGLDDDVAEDFWCHYQSSEIHPIGWSSLVGHTLQPPIGELNFWEQMMMLRDGELCPGLNSFTKFTKTAKICDYRNFRKICSSC